MPLKHNGTVSVKWFVQEECTQKYLSTKKDVPVGLYKIIYSINSLFPALAVQFRMNVI